MYKKIIIALILIFSFLPSKAELLDTSQPLYLFTFGVRAGFNTSNRTFPAGHFNMWNNNGWGTGGDVGILANINLREFISIQPGIFFDTRSGSFSYLTAYINYFDNEDVHYEMGRLRGYNVTVPVMVVMKFNIASKLKFTGEVGPYYQLSLKQTGQNNVSILYREPQSNDYLSYRAKLKKYDVGLKIGFGTLLYDNYYIGVHYLAGFMDAWKLPAGGRNKEWLFTLGYDF